MNEVPRDQLCQLVARYGPSLGEDPQRCESLLRDLCTGYKREVHSLASPARELVPAELLASKSGTAPTLVLARLTKRLQDNLGLSEETARWAVESWALALGVLSHPPPAPPISAPKATRPPALPASPRAGQPVYVPPPPVHVPLPHEEPEMALMACPFCGGHISAMARKCMHCGETIDVALRAAEEAQRAAQRGVSVNNEVHVHRDNARSRSVREFPHLMHLILTFSTCGAWLPLYVLHYLVSSRDILTFLVRLAGMGLFLAILAVAGFFSYGAITTRGIPFATNLVEREMTTPKLKKIALGLRTYQDRHGRLPPAVLQDPDGQPYSWRVAILPFIGEGGLYDSYNRKEAWDSPHNRAVLARMPQIYAPPIRETPGPNMTFFQVIVGPGTAFDGGQGMLVPNDFPNGPSRTVLVVEAAEAVSWTRPEDLLYRPNKPLPKLGGPSGEIRVSFADGSTKALPKDTQESVLRDFIIRTAEISPDRKR